MKVGDVLDRWEGVAEPGKVAEFERAVHRPEKSDVLPPTFLVVLGASFVERLVSDILPVDRTRVVHGEQSYQWLAEVRAGARLQAEAVLAEMSEKAGRNGTLRFFTVEITWCSEGRPVCRDRSVIVERVPG